MTRVLALALLALSNSALAQTVSLDPHTVRALAAERAPLVALGLAALDEARSVREAGARQGPGNPVLSLRAGPRFLREEGSPVLLDVNLALTWPLDLGGVTPARGAHLSAAERSAEAHLDEARWRAVGLALEALLDAVAEGHRAALARARLDTDEALARCARARRDAGTTGDGDVALTEALRAEARARLLLAEGRQRAHLETLRGALGLGPEATLVPAEEPDPAAPLGPLDALLRGLSRRADLVRDRAAIGEARADEALQARLGLPVPRLSFQGVRENELFAQAGVELPLPVYDRNQTARGLASARVRHRERALAVALRAAEAELRAAYARWEGALGAFRALSEAAPAADSAERLAARAYELGQRDLTSALAVRREALTLREALGESRAELARARLAVLTAAGVAE